MPFPSHRVFLDFLEPTIHAIKNAAARLRLSLLLNSKTLTFDGRGNFALHYLLRTQDAEFSASFYQRFTVLLSFSSAALEYMEKNGSELSPKLVPFDC